MAGVVHEAVHGSKPVFLHFAGIHGAGHVELCGRVKDVVSGGGGAVIDCRSSEWMKDVFRVACEGKAAGEAALDLTKVARMLCMEELKRDVDITASQYLAISQGLPVQLTWRGRVPKYVLQSLQGCEGVSIHIHRHDASSLLSWVQATFQLPRVVMLSGNELPAMDVSQLAPAWADAMAKIPFKCPIVAIHD